MKDADEACDDGNANERDGCTWMCTIAVCGNGTIEGSEECDIGEQNSDTMPNRCRTVCRKANCGDGVVDADEECDDANDEEADGCLRTCKLKCPTGSTKIQSRCLILKEEEACGVLCQANNAWQGFVTWVFSFFE